MNNKVPVILFVIYLIVFAICAISPYDRGVWWAENLPIMILVVTLIIIHFYQKFSALSYFLMACLVILHTIGGHYTFERVPFGFVTDLFGFERNHYDRVAHFSVGFYAFPIAELLLRRRLVNSRWILFLFPIFTIFTVAGIYEIFEWLYALSAESDKGTAVLGSQGDMWDAQKDILADGLGSLFSMALFAVVFGKEIGAMGAKDGSE
jgi:putative membrane protein